jgi:hypothetical protein
MQINYGLVAILRSDAVTDDNDSVDIHHFVGFEESPTFHDYILLYAELSVDDDLGLVDIADKLVLLPASSDALAYFSKMAENS